MGLIKFKFNSLPVSVNKLYFERQGRRILSSEGRAFKTKFITAGGGASKKDLMDFAADPTKEYFLLLKFYIRQKRLINEKYGTDKRIKYQFKRLDVSNLVKLAEDSIASLLDIPDKNNFKILLSKIPIPDDSEEYMIAILGDISSKFINEEILDIVMEAMNE